MNGIPVARVLGFEIRLHPSWILIVALIAVFSIVQLEASAPDAPMYVRWIAAGVIAAAFLVSVLAHELGHGIAARRLGLEVGPITLYFFGGSASLQVDAERPREAAIVAAAGPLVSLVLGALLAAIAFVATTSAIGTVVAAGWVILVLAVLNVILGAANLVPAYPLDGGRVVRAVIWARSGDERRGARAAARSGRFVGWVLIALGVLLMLTTDTINGLMLALSGWFFGSASRAIDRRLIVQDLLTGVRVDDVMERDVKTVNAQLTVDTFGERLLDGEETSALPVIRDDEVVGLIGVSQLRRLRRALWPTTRAEDVMIAPPRLPFLAAGDSLWSALDRIRQTGLDGLPVVEGAGLLGVVTKQGIAAMIQSRAEMRGLTIR